LNRKPKTKTIELEISPDLENIEISTQNTILVAGIF
jgi:hypothetical protein